MHANDLSSFFDVELIFKPFGQKKKKKKKTFAKIPGRIENAFG